MSTSAGSRTCVSWLVIGLLSALAAGCGGNGKQPIFGASGIAGIAPMVTAVTPLDGEASVPLNTAIITAAFSEPMAPFTGTASFEITCNSPCVNPAGTLALNAAGQVAVFTLSADLAPDTLYTVTISGARSLSTGFELARPYEWHFTTGMAPDTTAPTVSSTSPRANADGVAINTLISASFSEPMDPLTINTASFLLACPAGTPITGTVGYAVSGSVATFTPAGALPASTTCTATIGIGVQDVAHNALANAYSWSFTTGIAPDTTPPTVSSTGPVPGATGVALNALVSAGFSEPIDPLSINTATFALACPAGAPIVGTVGYAVNGNVATFTPASALPASTTCTATISTGVQDVAHNGLAGAYTWSFTTGVTPDTTPPSVSSTSPLRNAGGVAINTLVTASFSESMDPLTINTATFSLVCPAGTAIAGTVGYAVSGNAATFTPASTLPASTTCTATISTGVQDVAHNALASTYSWSFTTGVAPDTTPPTVSSTGPVPGASGVALNTLITASFSEPIDPLTINTASFLLACPAGTPITGTVGYAVSGNVATFSPASALPASTTCTATISTGVQDVAHNALATPYTWSFSTGVAPDTTPPTVSSTSPLGNAGGVAVNALVTASFSEPMDPLTISTATFSLACPAGTPIAGTVGYTVSGNAATFTPTSPLPASTTCTATISTGVQDVAHNVLANAYSWSFTTGVAPDTTPPTVSTTGPVAGAAGVALNTLITASFSEPMDPLTISTANFSLACPTGMPITGTVAYAVSGSVATFTPASALPSTTCTATISTGVQDVAHNALASAYTWSFTTGVAPDTTPPTVSSTSPLGNASGVAVNTLITASFSEPMDPLTISTATFSLACTSGAPVTGTVAYAVNGNAATFTPASALPASTICTATISTGVQDVAHNALANTYTWSFTTGVAPDTTPPTVSSTSPLGNASGVAVNALITASFSEPMDPLTISTATFSLACPAGTPIMGTVGYAVSGNIATFTPASALPASTTCTATISAGVQDVAHNALASTYTWSFSTGVAPDTTPPTVSSTNPADGAVGVCINKTVSVTFSEAMDPLTITTATFTLAATLGGSVVGVVVYDASTHIATFQPTAALTGTPATNYTATVKGGVNGVKDLAGNPLAIDVTTTFTTNSSTCTTAPALGATASFGAFGGSATLTNDGLATVINGDIGVNAASTSITGLHDSGGNDYTITTNNNGTVNGLVYTAGQGVLQVLADAQAAFNSISPANLPGGINVASVVQCPSCGGLGNGADELAGRTLPPGIYLSATGTFDIGGAARTQASLTLDAGGDPNAVWVFQTTPGTGTLNVGLTGPATPAVPIQVVLINGARANNVFWFVPAGATIGTGSTLAGTLLANASITMSTTGGSPPSAVVTTINGRAIALTAAVTMTNTVINVPQP